LFGPMGKVFEKKTKPKPADPGAEPALASVPHQAGDHQNGATPIDRPHGMRETQGAGIRRQA
jgi:hypothetical protein